MPEPTILIHDASCRAIYAVPMSHVRQVTISDFHTPVDEAEVTVYVELRVTNETSKFIESDKHYAILTYRGLNHFQSSPEISGSLENGLAIFSNFTRSKVDIGLYMPAKAPAAVEAGLVDIKPNETAAQALEDLRVFIPKNTVD